MKKMHWSTALKIENQKQAAEIEALRNGIIELRSYCTSEKFNKDTKVETSDIDARLIGIAFDGTDARDKFEEMKAKQIVDEFERMRMNGYTYETTMKILVLQYEIDESEIQKTLVAAGSQIESHA